MSVTGIIQEEVEYASCDCCGLTEECTPAYISLVRSRYIYIYIYCDNSFLKDRSNRNISIFQSKIRYHLFSGTTGGGSVGCVGRRWRRRLRGRLTWRYRQSKRWSATSASVVRCDPLRQIT